MRNLFFCFITLLISCLQIKKTSELGDQENLMCSISPFSKITQSTKKTALFLHSRKCKQFKKKSGYETLTDCLLSHDFSKGTKRATDKSKQILKAKAAGAEDGSLMKMKRKVQKQQSKQQQNERELTSSQEQ